MRTAAIFQCLNCRLAVRAKVSGGANRATLLALTHCPRCGYYDRGVASHNRRTQRFVQITLLIAFMLAALAVLLVAPRVLFAISVGVLALVFVIVTRRLRTRYPHEVEGRVILVDGTAR